MANTATVSSKEISTLSGQETAGPQTPVVISSGEITNFRTPKPVVRTGDQFLKSPETVVSGTGNIVPNTLVRVEDVFGNSPEAGVVIGPDQKKQFRDGQIALAIGRIS